MRWTEASWPRNVFPSLREGVKRTSIIVEAVGQQITVFINGYQIAPIEDGGFVEGQVGMAAFGTGHIFFDDLLVEGRQ